MVKLLYILVAVLISFVILPFRWVGAAFIVLSCLALLYARVFARVVPLLGFSFLILISIVIIQGLFMPVIRRPLLTFWG